MPRGRRGDQQIETELSDVYAPAGTVWTANSTFHIAPSPTGFQVVAGAATAKSGDFLLSAGKYLDLVINVTAIGTSTFTVTVLGVDLASGTTYTILASTALAANAQTVLHIGPALTAAANAVANAILPPAYAIQVVIGAASAVTASLGGGQME